MNKFVQLLLALTLASTLFVLDVNLVQAESKAIKTVENEVSRVIKAKAADVVPDAGLKRCINHKYLGRGDGTLKISSDSLDVLNGRITALDCEGYGIKDLTGVEYLTDFSHFYFADNEITSLEPMKNLTEVTALYLANNGIRVLNPIKKMTKLVSLSISNNHISNVSILTYFPSLENVHFDGNEVTDISMLGSLKARGGSFNFLSQKISDKTLVYFSADEPSVLTFYDINGSVVGNIQPDLNDFSKENDYHPTYKGSWSGDYLFSGRYEIKVTLAKPITEITGHDIDINLGASYDEAQFIQDAKLKVIKGMGFNEELHRSAYDIDLSGVNFNKPGIYNVKVTVLETTDYFGSSKIFKVNVR